MTSTVSKTQPRRSSGIERRQALLEATLRLVAREGIRAVKHRAVASEAGVPLAATTYYFDSIEQLLTESFRFWTQTKDVHMAQYSQSLAEHLPAVAAAPAGSPERSELAGKIRDATVDYVLQQARMTDDRVIELAFKHEALRSEALRQLVIEQDQRFVDNVLAMLSATGNRDPDSEAEIILAVILRLEQQAVINSIDEVKIGKVITRQIERVLEVTVDKWYDRTN